MAEPIRSVPPPLFQPDELHHVVITVDTFTRDQLLAKLGREPEPRVELRISALAYEGELRSSLGRVWAKAEELEQQLHDYSRESERSVSQPDTTCIAVLTKNPEQVESYLGFGAEIVQGGRSGEFAALILEVPRGHARWQAERLLSGLHGARVVEPEDLEDWKVEVDYQPEY